MNNSLDLKITQNGEIVFQYGENTAAAQVAAAQAEAALAEIRNASGPFAHPENLDEALGQVISVELYERVNGVDINWPTTNIVLREFSRRASDNRARIRIAEHIGPNIYYDLGRESLATAQFIDLTGVTGEVEVPIYADEGVGATPLGVPEGTEIGRVRFFTKAEGYGNYTGTYDESQGGLVEDRLFLSVAEKQAIGETVEVKAGEVVDKYNGSPFLREASDNYARKVFSDITVEGAEKGLGLYLNYETIYFVDISTYRVRLFLMSATLGAEVARWTWQGSAADLASQSQIPTAFLSLALQGLPLADLGIPDVPYMGISAIAHINWDNVDWTKVLTTYTDTSATGISDDRVYTNEEMDAFLFGSDPKIVKTIGANPDAGYATLEAAVTSVYYPGITRSRSYWPNSDITGFTNQVLFDIVDANHDEEIGAFDSGGNEQSSILVPYFSTIKLNGGRLYMDAAPSLAPVLEAQHSMRLIGPGTIEQLGNGYTVHVDPAENKLSKRATVGPPILRQRWRHVFEDINFINHGTAGNSGAIGSGYGNGGTMIFRRCKFIREGTGTGPLFIQHTQPNTTDPYLLIFEDCYFNDELIDGSAAIALIKGDLMDGLRHRVVINNTKLGRIGASVSVGTENGYVLMGRVGPNVQVDGGIDLAVEEGGGISGITFDDTNQEFDVTGGMDLEGFVRIRGWRGFAPTASEGGALEMGYRTDSDQAVIQPLSREPFGLKPLYIGAETIAFAAGFTTILTLNSTSAAFSQRVTTPASTTTQAGFNISAGDAPTAPVVGDIWLNNGGVYARLGNATISLASGTPEIRNNSTVAAGVGAFIVGAATSGSSSWTTKPVGVYKVKFEDGGDWEISYSYWDGTNLSRSDSQRIASSTGAALLLTVHGTATLLESLQVLETNGATHGWVAIPNGTGMQAFGANAVTILGTASAAAALAGTNYLTEQPRVIYTSATTANSSTGVHRSDSHAIRSATAGRGGFVFQSRFGIAQLPAGPRFQTGLATSLPAATTEPSAHTASLALFAKDSTDTNIQCVTNDGSGAGTKIDTGIALAVDGVYHAEIWNEPGVARVHFLLVRVDTGAIFYTSTTSDLPVAGTALGVNTFGSLNGTNTGTAFVLAMMSMLIRNGVR